jgi:hypothetical protein
VGQGKVRQIHDVGDASMALPSEVYVSIDVFFIRTSPVNNTVASGTFLMNNSFRTLSMRATQGTRSLVLFTE